MTKNHQIWAKSETDNTYCLVKVKFKKPYLFTRIIKKQARHSLDMHWNAE